MRTKRVWRFGDDLRYVRETTDALLTVGGPRTAMKVMRTFLPKYRAAAAAEDARDRLPESDTAGE